MYCLFLSQFKTIESVNAEEPFLLLSDVRCLSPWTLEIDRSSLTLVSSNPRFYM